MSKLIDFLSKLNKNRRNELRALKNTGRIITGYFCHYVPVEIIEACGCIPVRIKDNLNDKYETAGRKHIQRDSCSFCKAALGSLVDNSEFTNLVYGTTCDQLRRLNEHISEKTDIDSFLFHAPRTHDKNSTLNLYRDEIFLLIEKLTARSKTEYRNEQLLERVEEWNKLRSFVNEIQRQRIDQPPVVTGREFFYLLSTAYFLGPESFLKVSDEIMEFIKTKETSREPLRIFLAGSIICTADDHLLNIIEEQSRAVIVGDNTCTGSGWMNNPLQYKQNIFENLLKNQFDNAQCPNKMPNDSLYEFTDKQIEKTKPDGIIYRSLKFCHPWNFEAKAFKNRYNIPFLHIDTDYSKANIGQIKTRVHAFYEMIIARKSEDRIK